MTALAFDRATASLRDADLHRRHGRVIDLIGLIVEATGLEAEVGEVCSIETGRGRPPVPAEVVGFRAGRTLLMALGEATGHRPGRARDARPAAPLRVDVSDDLLGRALDGLGRPIDGLGPIGDRSRARAPSRPRRPTRSSARGSPSASRSACARSTRSCPAAAASGSASSPARASASPRCSA